MSRFSSQVHSAATEDEEDGEDEQATPEPRPEPTRKGNAGYSKRAKATSKGNEEGPPPVVNIFTGGVKEGPRTGKDVPGRAKRTGPMRSFNESDMARQVMNPYEHAYLAKYHSIFGQQLMLSGRRANEGDQHEDPIHAAHRQDVLRQKSRRTEDEKDGTYGEDQQAKKPPKAKKPVAHDVVDNRSAKNKPTGHFEAALAAKNTQITDLVGCVNRLLEHATANPASHGPAVGSVSHIWPNMHDYWPIMYVRRPCGSRAHTHARPCAADFPPVPPPGFEIPDDRPALPRPEPWL